MFFKVQILAFTFLFNHTQTRKIIKVLHGVGNTDNEARCRTYFMFYTLCVKLFGENKRKRLQQ